MPRNWPFILLLIGGMLILSGQVDINPTPVDPVNPVVPVDPHVDPDSDVTDGTKWVLIVYDDDQRATYPKTQQDIFTSAPFRVWLRDKVSVAADGSSEFRIFASTVKMSEYVPQTWRDAMEQFKDTKKPFVAWSDGKKVYRADLPNSVTELQALLGGYLK